MTFNIKDVGVIAAINAKSQDEAMGYVDACVRGGIKGVELNNNINDIRNFVKSVRNKYHNLIIGVAEIVFSEGTNDLEGICDFVSTAYYNESINLICSEKSSTKYIPAAITITEAHRVFDAGNSVFKLYPAQLANPEYVKIVKSIIKNVKVISSGGINIDNMGYWLENGTDCVVVGKYLIESKDLNEVEERARKLVAKYEKYRLSNNK